MKNILLLFFLCSAWVAFGQYQYEVTTLIPENSNIIDDGLTLDENGTLYGSYWGIWQGAAGTHVLRYRPDGTYDTLAVGLFRPNGITYHDGAVFVASSGNGQLVRIDTNGVKTVVANLAGGVSNAVPVPGTDSLVITSWAQNQILGINSSGTMNTVYSSPLFNGAVGAAFDPQGRLYIGNFNDGKILRLADGVLEEYVDLGGGIGFLTYSDGAILATNHTDKKVYRINLADDSIEVIAGSGTPTIEDGIGVEASFKSPNGIAATPSGDTIYVSEFAGKALRMIIRKADIPNSVSEVGQAALPRVFPIPNNGMMNIDLGDTDQLARAILQDSSGRVLQTFLPSELSAAALDLSHLTAGTYVLFFENQQGNIWHTISIPIVK